MKDQPNVSGTTPTPSEVNYITEINKSRVIIQDLNQLSENLKTKNWHEVVKYHEEIIIRNLDSLNKYYHRNRLRDN